ncbi:MAG: nitroreductase family protein [Nitrososphaerales archaeon]
MAADRKPAPVYAGVDEDDRALPQATIAEVLQRVGCVSEYDDQPIEDDVLAAIVRAAAWTPSAANIQPWEIVAVRSEELKACIGGCLLDSHLRPNVGGDARRSWVCTVPLLLVVCLDRTRAKTRYGDIGAELFGIQDTGAAVQNMRLVALGLGIKSCLVREFDRDKMAAVLELPSHVRPLIMIAMGYSDLEARPLPRLPLSDYLHQERW